MKTVRIEAEDLLEALHENLARHEENLETFLAERRERMVEVLTDALFDLNAHPEDGEYTHGKESYHFPMPTDNTESYKRAIRMVEMSVDRVIELEQHEFDQYVLDNWAWKDAFMRSATHYNLAGKLK